ncbi:elongation factor P [Muribaculum intestinale]|uniref:elongation factor P n=1 Tax=Muribaculum intestinale TaxID=1796646 RepID=UPI0026E004A8|nr:elongation factor P [Muribaculum intestinale]
MATTADFKNGMCLDIDGNYFFIVEFLHVKPGKGPAFVRTKLRNVKTGRIIDKTWNSGVKVEEVRIERRPYQFSYKDDMGYHFLHTETWEEIIVAGESIEGVEFLKDGDICEAMVHAAYETVHTCEMPANVVLEITYTEPGIKGDTATNTLKPATVETGAEVRVPLFCEVGDKVRVDTRNGSYLERVERAKA